MLADANERIDWYQCRWIIEEYHKALKTGCQIEDMQFTTEDRLQPAIALISVVGVSLLQLRDASRRADAEDAFGHGPLSCVVGHGAQPVALRETTNRSDRA